MGGGPAAGEGQKASPTLLTLWQGWSENDMQKLSTDKQAGYKKARERLEPIISRKSIHFP